MINYYQITIENVDYRADYQQLLAKYQPIFKKISEGTVLRENDRKLPFVEIDWLKKAGFGAVRVPVEYGGDGASIPQLFQLLIELAKADPNISQALRGHFAFVEDRLIAHRDNDQSIWFERFVKGEIVGNAWTEIGEVKIGNVQTKLSQVTTEQGTSWRVNGQKFYSTGSIFAEWLDLYAQNSTTDEHVIAVTRVAQQGVVIEDDWDGFGQKTTGSGTATLTDAHVDAEHILPFDTRFKYQTAFYQLVLTASIVGIAHAAVDAFSEQIRKRTRVFSHGNSDRADQDVQILQVVGKAFAQAYASQTSTIQAAHASQAAFISHFTQDDHVDKQANIQAEIEASQAQIVVSDLVLELTSKLFDTLAASAGIRNKQLDRFWRNARIISSHNPLIYKEKILGDWQVNGTEPVFIWQIGAGGKNNR